MVRGVATHRCPRVSLDVRLSVTRLQVRPYAPHGVVGTGVAVILAQKWALSSLTRALFGPLSAPLWNSAHVCTLHIASIAHHRSQTRPGTGTGPLGRGQGLDTRPLRTLARVDELITTPVPPRSEFSGGFWLFRADWLPRGKLRHYVSEFRTGVIAFTALATGLAFPLQKQGFDLLLLICGGPSEPGWGTPPRGVPPSPPFGRPVSMVSSKGVLRTAPL